MIQHHEGFRSKPYRDSVGKLRIGYGRNLDDVGLRRSEGAYLLANDLQEAEQDLDAHFSWWRSMDIVRQAVLLDMRYNLGPGGLRTFTRTLPYMQHGRYVSTARRMLQSRWAEQTKTRARRLAAIMESGMLPIDVPNLDPHLAD